MKLLAFLFLATTGVAIAATPEKNFPDAARLDQMAARLAPTDLAVDISKLSSSDRRVLVKLIEAAKVIDGLYLRQVWSGNTATLLNLIRDLSPEGRARLHYFRLNKGPWSRLDNDKPFIPGVPAKPESAGFYPDDVSKADMEKWIASLPEADRAQAKGFFTVIKHSADPSATGAKAFQIVPYNVEYQSELTRAAGFLREAADAATEPSLKKFLNNRADAFLSNAYYQSDVDWMELTGPIEPTIGPYEVYEDGWFNYKAAFEAFITLQDEAETAKLQKLSGQMQDIEDHLPIDPKYRNPKLGALAPIVVVNDIYCAGDGDRGVQSAAYNLPNDERVTHEKGSKRVMLKNMQDAKFNKVLVPIAKVVLSPADQKNLSFDAFFTHILVHEVMHGLGPHNITVDGRQTTVRQEMKEAGSALEEAKADISSLFAIQYLIDKGVMPKSLEQNLYPTYLASAFRSIRFGLNEAHGRGVALQLNYLLDYGAFTVRPDGTFAVNPAKIKEGVAALTREIMTIQAEGHYAKAKEMQDRLSVNRPETQRALNKLTKIPIDIEPHWVTAEQLLRESQ